MSDAAQVGDSSPLYGLPYDFVKVQIGELKTGELAGLGMRYAFLGRFLDQQALKHYSCQLSTPTR